MHGGGGEDIFVFGDNWGNDKVDQLATGKVILWFKNGDESKWDEALRTYTDGVNSVTVVTGDAEVSLRFGDDGGNAWEQYNYLRSIGAFDGFASDRIFQDRGMLA